MTTPERVEALPDLPTTAEAGLPDVEVGVWHGVYVPAETPDEVVKTLTDALAAALDDETVVTKLAELGTAPVPPDEVTPEAHRRSCRSRSTCGRRSSRTPASPPAAETGGPEVSEPSRPGRAPATTASPAGCSSRSALAFAVGATRYELGTALKMGPGYVPLVLGLVLVRLGWSSSDRGDGAGPGDARRRPGRSR